MIGAGLMLLTGIGWYVGQVEPDCMTALVVLGSYLLLFRSRRWTALARWLVVAITALAVACHPSHLGLIGGFLIVAWLASALPRWLARIAQARPASSRLIALALSLALILASNFALARAVFHFSRSGSVFVFARLMQDGIVKRLLDDTCPQSGYQLCPYRTGCRTTPMPGCGARTACSTARAALPAFPGRRKRMIVDSLRRYPLMQVKAAVYDSVLQFFTFKHRRRHRIAGSDPEARIQAG